MDVDPKKCNFVAIPFYVADASGQEQSATEMSAAGEVTAADVPQVPMPWAGCIVGIAVQVEAARTAGALTIRPTIDGVAAAEAVTIDADNVQYITDTWRRWRYPVAADERVGCTWASDATWAAGTTPSVHVTLFVHIEDVD